MICNKGYFVRGKKQLPDLSRLANKILHNKAFLTPLFVYFLARAALYQIAVANFDNLQRHILWQVARGTFESLPFLRS